MRKEFEAASATVRANTAGFAPAPRAMLMASGTSSTVAPTFDISRVKAVVSTARAPCSTHSGTSPSRCSVSCAIQAAVPVVSTASPSGNRPASRNTLCQPTDRYASSMVMTPLRIMPTAPVSSASERRMSVKIVSPMASRKNTSAWYTRCGRVTS